MSGMKSLLVSKTFWGAVLSFGSILAMKSGYNIGDSDGWAIALSGLAGSVIAVYGRIKAVKKIG